MTHDPRIPADGLGQPRVPWLSHSGCERCPHVDHDDERRTHVQHETGRVGGHRFGGGTVIVRALMALLGMSLVVIGMGMMIMGIGIPLLILGLGLLSAALEAGRTPRR